MNEGLKKAKESVKGFAIAGKQVYIGITTQDGITRPMTNLGRNKPCKCGSGKKLKKCCLLNDRRKEHNTQVWIDQNGGVEVVRQRYLEMAREQVALNPLHPMYSLDDLAISLMQADCENDLAEELND